MRSPRQIAKLRGVSINDVLGVENAEETNSQDA